MPGLPGARGVAVTLAYVFDVFGTCVDWRAGVARAAGRAFAERGLEADPAAFADAWRALYQPAMERVRSGERGYADLDDLHRENLDAALDGFGIAAAFDGPARDALNHAWEQLPPWPDTLPGLTALRRHAIVAPCSNGSVALMTRLARWAGLPWDCVLGAGVARAYKPQPEVYLASCAALRLPPERVMMVAAHNDDLRAARAVGLRTAFFPRPLEHGPGQTTDLAPTDDWDVSAHDMIDLAERAEASGRLSSRR